MENYINFSEKASKLYKDAEKETVRLILESGLTEVVLSDQCDIAYAQHDNGYSLSEDMVTIVKVGEHSMVRNISCSNVTVQIPKMMNGNIITKYKVVLLLIFTKLFTKL